MTIMQRATNGAPLITRWWDLGEAILRVLRAQPADGRMKGRVLKLLMKEGFFTKEEIKEKKAPAAVSTMMKKLRDEGKIRETENFTDGGYSLFSPIGAVVPTVELAQKFRDWLNVEDTMEGPWWTLGVIEERGRMDLVMKRAVLIPQMKGDKRPQTTSTVTLRLDPRWSEDAPRFSWDVDMRTAHRREFRAEFDKRITALVAGFDFDKGEARAPTMVEEAVAATPNLNEVEDLGPADEEPTEEETTEEVDNDEKAGQE